MPLNRTTATPISTPAPALTAKWERSRNNSRVLTNSVVLQPFSFPFASPSSATASFSQRARAQQQQRQNNVEHGCCCSSERTERDERQRIAEETAPYRDPEQSHGDIGRAMGRRGQRQGGGYARHRCGRCLQVSGRVIK